MEGDANVRVVDVDDNELRVDVVDKIDDKGVFNME
jgi:hypothetical protein